MAGTRPYWWVNETDLFTNLTRPYVRQTYLTCETTAGNPSGHVMFTASILFFVIKTIFYQSPWFQRYSSKSFKFFIWNIYVFILGLISISRMFFACHFFHQCIFGLCFGIAISQFLQKRNVNRFLMEMNRKRSFLLGFTMLSICISIYFAHFIISQDPQWTVKKVMHLRKTIYCLIKFKDKIYYMLNQAFNWCKDPYYIKPETTPIYSLSREFGLLFGLILCSPLAKR